jgi:WD40 repeat protein
MRLATSGSIQDDTQPGWRIGVRVFDLAVGKPIRTLERAAREGVNALAMTPDGKLLFTLDRNGKLRIEEVATGAELLTQQFPGDVVAAIAVSPDGSTIAVASGPNTHKMFVWKWQAAEEPREITAPGRYRGRRLTFSPHGKWIAGCSDLDPDVRVWDIASSRLLRRLEPPDHERYRHLDVAFSPDGKLLAAYGMANQRSAVHLWDPATGRFVKRLDKGGLLAFSADGKLLVAGLCVWDMVSGKELSANDEAHRGYLWQIVAGGNNLVVTAGDDHTIRVWDAATGKHLRCMAHEDRVGGVALSHDGRLLASSGIDDAVCLWDVATGKRIYQLPGHGQLGTVWRPVVFTADDRSFLTWGPDMYLRKWDVRTGKAVAEHLIQPTGVRILTEDDEPFSRREFDIRFGSAQFTTDGKYLVLQVNNKCFVFDAATGQELRSFPSEGGIQIGMAISMDGKLLLASAWGKLVETKLPDGTMQSSAPKAHPVTWWDLATGAQRHQITLPEQGAGPVAFSPDGKQFAVVSSRPGSCIRLIDVETGRELRKIEGLRSVVRALAFMPDGKRLVSGMEDSSALIWDVTR